MDAVLRVDHEASARRPPPPIRRRRPGSSGPTGRQRRRARSASAAPGRRPAGAPAGLPRGWCSTGTPRRAGRRSARRRASDSRSACAWRPAPARRASVLPCFSVPKSEKPNSVFVHMSRPPSATPTSVPKRDQSGLTLRTRFRSLPMSRGAPAVLVARRARHWRGRPRSPPRHARPPACRTAPRCGCP